MDKANQSDISKDLRSALDEIRALREEASLKIHLASMDARDAWRKIESSIEDAERDAAQALDAALRRVESTARKAREFVATI